MKPIIAAHRLPTSPLGKLPRSLAPLRIRSRNHVAGRQPTVWGGHSCPPPLTSKRRTDHPRAWPIRTPTQNRMPHPWQFHGWAAANFPARYPSQLNRSRLCSIIPLGWPTLTLKGAPFKLRLGGAFLDPNRPRSYPSLDTIPTASASAYIFSIRSMYRASTTRRRTFMLAVSAPFSGENSSAINITFFNCSKRARF
jgi:hypothetical protein